MSFETGQVQAKLHLSNTGEFVQNESHYAELTATIDGKVGDWCIHPTLANGYALGEFPVTRQIPGGLFGWGLITAAALNETQDDSDKVHTVEEGMSRYSEIDTSSAPTVHYGCALRNNIALVVGEMASPSEPTLDKMSIMAWNLNSLRDGAKEDIEATAKRAQEGAKKLHETLQKTDEGGDELHEHASELHGKENVLEVYTKNTALYYTWNFHRHKNLNNNARPKDLTRALAIQSYIDTPGANFARLEALASNPAVKKLAALMLPLAVSLSSSTHTIITSGREKDFTNHTVLPDSVTDGAVVVRRGLVKV